MQIWLSLLGTLLGAFVALSAIWLKDRIDRRREAQLWFEKKYITDGVDLLSTWFLYQKIKINQTTHTHKFAFQESMEIFPLNAIAIIDTLFEKPFLLQAANSIIKTANASYLRYDFNAELRKNISESVIADIDIILKGLHELRSMLQGVRIKDKTYTINLTNSQEFRQWRATFLRELGESGKISLTATVKLMAYINSLDEDALLEATENKSL